MHKRTKVFDASKWHRWFAWRPVQTVDGFDVWWEWIWRRLEYGYDTWSYYSHEKPNDPQHGIQE